MKWESGGSPALIGEFMDYLCILFGSLVGFVFGAIASIFWLNKEAEKCADYDWDMTDYRPIIERNRNEN